MKYPMIITVLAAVVLVIVQFCFFSFGKEDAVDRAKSIARQMRVAGAQCQCCSSDQMKAVRLEFLNSNRDATISQLVEAINTPIDGETIIPFLRSLNGSVCTEYANSVERDKGKGDWAKRVWLGDRTIGEALDSGRLV